MQSSPGHSSLPDNRPVLTACAIAAVLVLLVFYCYHKAAMHRDMVSTTLLVGSQSLPHDSAAVAFAASFKSPDENTIRLERLAKNPSIAQLSAIQHVSDARRWISRHVYLRRIGNNRIEVCALGEGSTDNLAELAETAVDLIRNDAGTSNIPVSVILKMETTGRR